MTYLYEYEEKVVQKKTNLDHTVDYMNKKLGVPLITPYKCNRILESIDDLTDIEPFVTKYRQLLMYVPYDDSYANPTYIGSTMQRDFKAYFDLFMEKNKKKIISDRFKDPAEKVLTILGVDVREEEAYSARHHLLNELKKVNLVFWKGENQKTAFDILPSWKFNYFDQEKNAYMFCIGDD